MLTIEVRSAYQLVGNNNNYSNNMVHQKQNECQVLLSPLAQRMMRKMDIHFDYGSTVEALFRLVYQTVRNDNLFSKYYQGGYDKNSKIKNNEDLIDIQCEDHQIVKNEVVRYDNLSILQIVLLIFLQLKCKWILNMYQVDNDNDLKWLITSATKVECLEWYMQKYRVNNDTNLDYILKRYQVDNVYKPKYSKYKHNDYQLLLF